MAERFDDQEWDESDLRVGQALYWFTGAIMVTTCAILIWMGYARRPLLGWPVLGGIAFVLLRVWKRMLRGTLDDLEVHLHEQDTVFEVLPEQDGTGEPVDSASRPVPGSAVTIMKLALYAVFITLVWYGIGRGIRALVGLI